MTNVILLDKTISFFKAKNKIITKKKAEIENDRNKIILLFFIFFTAFLLLLKDKAKGIENKN